MLGIRGGDGEVTAVGGIFSLPKSASHRYHQLMFDLRNRITLAVAAVLLSAVQSLANEACVANVNECTPLQLCEASTSIVNDQKYTGRN